MNEAPLISSLPSNSIFLYNTRNAQISSIQKKKKKQLIIHHKQPPPNYTLSFSVLSLSNAY